MKAIMPFLLLLLGHVLGAESVLPGAPDSRTPIFRDPSFEQLSRIIVVSKRPEDILEAPGTVYVITDKDIQRYGWRDMRELLWAIPNMDMYWNWNAANGGQRGFTGNSAGTLLLIDGREVQNLVADEAMMLNFPVHRIKRVEVLQGPGSAIYGTNANEGVINIVTRTADPEQRDTSLAGFLAGESEMKGAYALMRRNSGDVSVGISTSYFSTLNDYANLRAFAVDDANYSRNPPLDSVREHDPAHAFFPVESQTIDFFASSRHLYAGSNYFREQSLPGIERARARFGERQNDRYMFLAFGGLRMERGAFQGFTDYTFTRERVNSLGGTAVRSVPNRVFRPERHRLKTQGNYRLANQTLVFGYDGWILDAELLQSANPGGLMYPFEPVQNFSSYLNSIFGEYSLHLMEGKVKLNVGMRLDKQEGLDPSFIPRIGLVYQPTADAAIKVLYGRGLRAANAWEVYNAANAGIGEEFPSRQTGNLEINYVQVVRKEGWTLSNSVSAYRMESTDNFNQVLGADNVYRLTFVKDKTVVGIEDFLRISYRGRYGGFLGARFIDPTRTTIAGEEVAEDVPLARGKLGMFAQPLPWIMVGAFIDASGEVKTDAATLDGKGVEALRIPGWVNTNLNFRLGDFPLDSGGGGKVGVSFFVENLFDETFYHPNHRGRQPIQFIQPPRNLRLTADMKF